MSQLSGPQYVKEGFPKETGGGVEETGWGRGELSEGVIFSRAPASAWSYEEVLESKPHLWVCTFSGEEAGLSHFCTSPRWPRAPPGAMAPGTWHSQQWLQLPGPEESGAHWLARTQKPGERPGSGYRHLRAPTASSIFRLRSCRNVTVCPRLHMRKFTFWESWGAPLSYICL